MIVRTTRIRACRSFFLWQLSRCSPSCWRSRRPLRGIAYAQRKRARKSAHARCGATYRHMDTSFALVAKNMNDRYCLGGKPRLVHTACCDARFEGKGVHVWFCENAGGEHVSSTGATGVVGTVRGREVAPRCSARAGIRHHRRELPSVAAFSSADEPYAEGRKGVTGATRRCGQSRAPATGGSDCPDSWLRGA